MRAPPKEPNHLILRAAPWLAELKLVEHSVIAEVGVGASGQVGRDLLHRESYSMPYRRPAVHSAPALHAAHDPGTCTGDERLITLPRPS